MHVYPDKVEARLREALDALERVKKPNGPDELRRALQSFLETTKFTLQPLQTEYSALPGFKEWWGKKVKELKEDPISSFFYHLRNEVTKAGKELLAISTQLQGPFVLVGPSMIASDGQAYMGVIDNSGVTRFKPHTLPGVRTTMRWHFRDCPPELTNINPIDLCSSYLATLDRITAEFIETFGSAK